MNIIAGMASSTPTFAIGIQGTLLTLLRVALIMAFVWNAVSCGVHWNSNDRPMLVRRGLYILMAAIVSIFIPSIVSWAEGLLK